MLPAITASPRALATGSDSPVSNDSSASVRPSISTPSAAKAWPDRHAQRVAGSQRLALIASTPPSPRRRAHALGRRPMAVFERGFGAMPRAHLQPAAAEQEADEHGQRIEVDLVRRTARRGRRLRRCWRRTRRTMPSATGTSMPMRRWRSDAPGAGEKRRSRERHHRQRQQPAGPVEQPLAVGRQLARRADVGGRGEHHDLHRAEGGDEQAPQRQPRLTLAQRTRLAPPCPARPCSRRGFDGTQQRRRACVRARSQRTRGAVRGRADLRSRAHRARRDSACSIACGTGRAVHAADAQRRTRRCLHQPAERSRHPTP